MGLGGYEVEGQVIEEGIEIGIEGTVIWVGRREPQRGRESSFHGGYCC